MAIIESKEMQFLFLWMITLLFHTVKVSVRTNHPGIAGEYKLIWFDEFDTNGPTDTTKWRFESGFVRNNETQWYQKENVLKSDGRNPFRQPYYLLLNLTIGGNRGGNMVNTKLPSKYLIDYVRVYQKQ